MMTPHTKLVLLTLILASLPAPAYAADELSKADRLFLKTGLVMNALCSWDCALHPKTVIDCGFTGTIWNSKTNLEQLASLKGLRWCKWVDDGQPLTPEEQKFSSTLVALQFHDEQNLNSDKILAGAKQWFEQMRPRFPNVILYTNQYGGLLTDANMARYIKECRPDMLSFDTYPMWKDQSNWRSYFGDLQRYRAFSAGAGIPFATWMQTFNGEDKYVNPSESELRLDIFGAWTFGAKMQSAFTYNAGSTSLFKKTFNGSGDTQIAPGYYHLKKILHESRNLSPYLSKLRCTDARWIKSPKSEYPWGVAPWSYDKDQFPQLRGITIKNNSKLLNGDPGDATLGFFKPLVGDKSEKWIMVTNALTDRNADASQAAQTITLNLILKDSDKLQKVNRLTGKLEPAPLKKVGEIGRCLLDLDLPGGTGDLLCLTTSN
jgi:hypothetical protein